MFVDIALLSNKIMTNANVMYSRYNNENTMIKENKIDIGE